MLVKTVKSNYPQPSQNPKLTRSQRIAAALATGFDAVVNDVDWIVNLDSDVVVADIWLEKLVTLSYSMPHELGGSSSHPKIHTVFTGFNEKLYFKRNPRDGQIDRT